MTRPYRIYGSEFSPYSVKVRSGFRYKRLPHEWIVRSSRCEEEFAKHARLPLVPLVVTPEGEAWQDSTPILEKLEALAPEPPFHPEDLALAFVSALIEEYADEWVNKPMFHHRWWRDPDRLVTSERLALSIAPDADGPEVARAAAGIRERMVGRLHFVGSSEFNQPVIEASYARLVDLLEEHLRARRFLFGGRPVFADFGLGHQLYECGLDVTSGALLRERGPDVLAWVERVLDPRPGGSLESWADLRPTLAPLLRDEIAGHFLPWSLANAGALATGEAEFEVQLAGGPFRQAPQKYHARSLAALRARYDAVGDHGALDPLLQETGCLASLRAAPAS